MRPSVSPSAENPDLVFQETGESQAGTHSRLAKCDSRQTIRLGQTIQSGFSLQRSSS